MVVVSSGGAAATELSTGAAVVVDGVIYRNNWSKELPENAEVFLMRRLSGG